MSKDNTTVDPRKTSYNVTLVTLSGKKYRINKVIEDLGWSENNGEIATKISFKASNEKTKKGALSSLCKPGSTIIVTANIGNGSIEVARGKVLSWKNILDNGSKTLDVIAYDNLYNLQKSQDYFLFAKGKTAKYRIEQVLGKWGMQISSYKGPKCRLGKKKYEARYLSDILMDILKKAGNKDSKKYIIRGTKGKIEVVERGSNKDVYLFDSSNSISRERSLDALNIVTKVKIVGKAKDAGTPKTISVVKGDTKKYGTLQQIYNKSDDESASEAKKTAKGIINKQGKIQQEGQIQALDVPFLRKGDRVKLNLGTLKGFYYVTSVSHDADDKTMTFSVKK